MYFAKHRGKCQKSKWSEVSSTNKTSKCQCPFNVQMWASSTLTDLGSCSASITGPHFDTKLRVHCWFVPFSVSGALRWMKRPFWGLVVCVVPLCSGSCVVEQHKRPMGHWCKRLFHNSCVFLWNQVSPSDYTRDSVLEVEILGFLPNVWMVFGIQMQVYGKGSTQFNRPLRALGNTCIWCRVSSMRVIFFKCLCYE